jgi:hypothetical protein
MSLRFFANTTTAIGNVLTTNYSRVQLGNFAVDTNQITLSAWVNVIDWGPTGSDPRIILKQNVASTYSAGQDRFQWFLGLNRESTADRPKTLRARFNYSATTILGNTPLINNKWHHAVAVYNGGTASLYLDGNLEITSSAFNSTPLTADTGLEYPVMLGNNGANTSGAIQPNAFNGHIAHPTIWNSALTADEILSLSLGLTSTKVKPANIVSYLGTKNIDIFRDPTIQAFNVVDGQIEPRIILGSRKQLKIKGRNRFVGVIVSPTVSVTAISSSSIQVSVTAEPTQGSVITSYLIQRSTAQDFTSNLEQFSTPNFEDFSLNPLTTYYYRARFTQSDGRISDWSETKFESTPDIDDPETGDLDLAAPTMTAISEFYESTDVTPITPIQLPTVTLSNATQNSINVNVAAVPVTGQTITSYLIQRTTTPNVADSWQQVFTGVNSSFTNTDLNPSTLYHYRARFTQSDGRISDFSQSKSLATTAAPVAPGTDLLFPRLGSFNFGGNRDYGSPAISDILSCCEINMLGWFDNAAHSPRDLEQMIQNIKAKATFPQYFYTYVRVNEFYHSRIFGENSQEPQVLLDKLTNNNWWLYPGSRTTGDIKYAQITAFDRVTKQLATSFASGTTTIRLQPTITLTLSSITGTFQSNEEVFVGTSLTSFNFKGRNNGITSGAMISNNSILGATDTARSLIGKTVRGATSNATANITNVSINLSGVGRGRSIRGPGLADNTVINSAVSLSLDSIFPAEVAITPATVSATSSGSYQIGPLAEVNITTFTVPDSRGLRAGEWLMELFGNQFFRSPAQGPTHPEFASILSNLSYAPSLDGLFIDNGFYPIPFVDGNWNRTGTNNTRSVIAPAWRTGYRDSARRFKSVFGKEIVINSSSLNSETATPGNEYYREFDGGGAEWLIGDAGTPDGSISFSSDFYENNVDVFRQKYRSVLDTYSDKKRAVTNCPIRGATDYELQAYAMALNMVMGDAACHLVGGVLGNVGNTYAPTWLDEIAVNKQTGQCYNGFSASGVKSGLRWLGKALEPGKAFPVNGVLPAPFVSGTSIFRRKFEFGEVYVNYRSSTTTFNLERPMKKLIGTQRPTVNNGQTVTSLTMGPKTAVFLLFP